MANHPNVDKIRLFVKRLKALVEQRSTQFTKQSVDMHCTGLYHNCGTPGCHAGWVHLAIPDILPPLRDYSWVVVSTRFGKWLLESTNHRSLEEWAEAYPDLWGSSNYHMFTDPEAFNQCTDRFDVQVIIDHWEGVANRIEQLVSN